MQKLVKSKRQYEEQKLVKSTTRNRCRLIVNYKYYHEAHVQQSKLQNEWKEAINKFLET